jgi:hypothetical protein
VSFAAAVCAHRNPAWKRAGTFERKSISMLVARARSAYDAAHERKLSANMARKPMTSRRYPTTKEPTICMNEKKETSRA